MAIRKRQDRALMIAVLIIGTLSCLAASDKTSLSQEAAEVTRQPELLRWIKRVDGEYDLDRSAVMGGKLRGHLRSVQNAGNFV